MVPLLLLVDFLPRTTMLLIVTASSNRVYALGVEAKQLGEWSMRHRFVLPKRFQEFPGEVIGISFPPSPISSSLIVYSARATSLINFGLSVEQEDSDRRNVEVVPFTNPILFLSHLSENSLLLIEKR